MSIAVQAGRPHPKSPGEQVLFTCYQMGLLPGLWLFNTPLKGFLVDLFHPDSRVVVEVDGVSYHTRPDRYAADRQRDRVLTMAGWKVLRFTHDEVIDTLWPTLAMIREAVSRSPR